MRLFSNGEPGLLDRLAEIVGALAVIAAVIVMVLGAVVALIENDYSGADYLSDLKALVLGLAAVLIALELPQAIHRRLQGGVRRAEPYERRAEQAALRAERAARRVELSRAASRAEPARAEPSEPA